MSSNASTPSASSIENANAIVETSGKSFHLPFSPSNLETPDSVGALSKRKASMLKGSSAKLSLVTLPFEQKVLYASRDFSQPNASFTEPAVGRVESHHSENVYSPNSSGSSSPVESDELPTKKHVPPTRPSAPPSRPARIPPPRPSYTPVKLHGFRSLSNVPEPPSAQSECTGQNSKPLSTAELNTLPKQSEPRRVPTVLPPSPAQTSSARHYSPRLSPFPPSLPSAPPSLSPAPPPSQHAAPFLRSDPLQQPPAPPTLPSTPQSLLPAPLSLYCAPLFLHSGPTSFPPSSATLPPTRSSFTTAVPLSLPSAPPYQQSPLPQPSAPPPPPYAPRTPSSSPPVSSRQSPAIIEVASTYIKKSAKKVCSLPRSFALRPSTNSTAETSTGGVNIQQSTDQVFSNHPRSTATMTAYSHPASCDVMTQSDYIQAPPQQSIFNLSNAAHRYGGRDLRASMIPPTDVIYSEPRPYMPTTEPFTPKVRRSFLGALTGNKRTFSSSHGASSSNGLNQTTSFNFGNLFTRMRGSSIDELDGGTDTRDRQSRVFFRNFRESSTNVDSIVYIPAKSNERPDTSFDDTFKNAGEGRETTCLNLSDDEILKQMACCCCWPVGLAALFLSKTVRNSSTLNSKCRPKPAYVRACQLRQLTDELYFYLSLKSCQLFMHPLR